MTLIHRKVTIRMLRRVRVHKEHQLLLHITVRIWSTHSVELIGDLHQLLVHLDPNFLTLKDKTWSVRKHSTVEMDHAPTRCE